jgi:hypothetical protein
LRFAFQYFEKEEDPARHMIILHALRWSLAVWQENVSQTTIENCWLKTRILTAKIGPQTRVETERTGWREDLMQDERRYNATLKQIEISIQALAMLGHVDALSVASFINPVTETINDEDGVLKDQIAQAYSQEATLADPEEPEDVIQPVKIADALASLATLRLYEDQQPDGSRKIIRQLDRLEREIRGRQTVHSIQNTLDSFLTAN